jgi:hypothetical protein
LSIGLLPLYYALIELSSVIRPFGSRQRGIANKKRLLFADSALGGGIIVLAGGGLTWGSTSQGHERTGLAVASVVVGVLGLVQIVLVQKFRKLPPSGTGASRVIVVEDKTGGWDSIPEGGRTP